MKISQWRDAGRRLEIAGVPVVLFTLYAAWFQWPEATTFYTVTGIILFFPHPLLLRFHHHHFVATPSPPAAGPATDGSSMVVPQVL